MKYGSVCSGIEAASIAWHPLGWRAAWLAEIEAFPSAVLAHHYPDVPNLGDMTQLTRRVLTGEIEAPDILVGGTPCQAFSVAGARAGLADPRGQLTLAYVGLADAIDTARHVCGRPPVVTVWENVPGVLSSKDNAFGCFLGALAGESSELQPPGGKWKDAGCVFGPTRTVAWRVLDAQYFGLAQRRRRVFVVSSAREGFDPTAVLFELEGLRRDSPPSRSAGQTTAGTLASRTTGGGFPGTDEACSGYLQPVVSTIDASYGRLQGCSGQDANHGHSHLVVHGTQDPCVSEDTAFALGRNNGGENAVLEVAYSTKLHNTTSNQAGKFYEENTPSLQAGSPPPAVAYYALQDTSGREKAQNGKGWSDDGVSYTLDATAGQGVAISVALRGREGGATAELGDDVAGCLRASSGGGDKPHVLAMSISENQRSEVNLVDHIRSLTSGGGKPGQGYAAALVGMAVRRLTPRECERLQGFPDDYTLVPHGKPSKAKLDADFIKYQLRGNPKHLSRDDIGRLAADGPRYKALGNSKAVPVVRWIGERIERVCSSIEMRN